MFPFAEPMIIDFHTHAFPDRLASNALRALRDGMKAQSGRDAVPATDGTYGGLLRLMEARGVDRSAVLPIATKPSQAHTINLTASAVQAQTAGGALICFGSVHPADPEAAAVVSALPELGLCGLKLHPEFQQSCIDGEESLRVLRAARDAGLCVVVHAGRDIGLPPPVHCTPERILRVLDRLPDLKLVAAHLGGWMMWDEAASLLGPSPVYFDTAFLSEFLSPARARDIILSHDPERTLFGSDCPWEDPGDTLAYLHSMELPPETETGILGANAVKLLQ